MDTATGYKKEITTDLAGVQAFLAERRLARDNQIPYFVRWVERFLWHCHGQLQDLSHDAVLRFRNVLENETTLQDWQVPQAENAVAIYLQQFRDVVRLIQRQATRACRSSPFPRASVRRYASLRQCRYRWSMRGGIPGRGASSVR